MACRDGVIGVVDVVKKGTFLKKGIVDLADFEPVFRPAAFTLLNILVIENEYPDASVRSPRTHPEILEKRRNGRAKDVFHQRKSVDGGGRREWFPDTR